jgi:hypothetical protein
MVPEFAATAAKHPIERAVVLRMASARAVRQLSPAGLRQPFPKRAAILDLWGGVSTGSLSDPSSREDQSTAALDTAAIVRNLR